VTLPGQPPPQSKQITKQIPQRARPNLNKNDVVTKISKAQFRLFVVTRRPRPLSGAIFGVIVV
jgi:hypothetical protein